MRIGKTLRNILLTGMILGTSISCNPIKHLSTKKVGNKQAEFYKIKDSGMIRIDIKQEDGDVKQYFLDKKLRVKYSQTIKNEEIKGFGYFQKKETENLNDLQEEVNKYLR